MQVLARLATGLGQLLEEGHHRIAHGLDVDAQSLPIDLKSRRPGRDRSVGLLRDYAETRFDLCERYLDPDVVGIRVSSEKMVRIS